METTEKLVTFTEEKNKGNVKNLIPVHINIMRCENYFWNWIAAYGDWIRGEALTEQYKRSINNPLVGSSYK